MQNDPRELPPSYGDGPANGIVSAFLPTGTLGILVAVFLGILIAIGAGLVHGIWLIASIVSLPMLVLLIRRALKAEMRRDDIRGGFRLTQTGSLPSDAELTDSERRNAMLGFSGEYKEHHDDG